MSPAPRAAVVPGRGTQSNRKSNWAANHREEEMRWKLHYKVITATRSSTSSLTSNLPPKFHHRVRSPFLYVTSTTTKLTESTRRTSKQTSSAKSALRISKVARTWNDEDLPVKLCLKMQELLGKWEFVWMVRVLGWGGANAPRQTVIIYRQYEMASPFSAPPPLSPFSSVARLGH